jgi:hypothetical protein
MAGESISRYLAQLGLKPGATLQQVNAQYYFRLKKFSEKENLTERDEESRQQIQHAYNVLKRAYASRGPVARTPVRKKTKRAAAKPVLPIFALVFVTLLAGGVLVAVNFQNLRIASVSFDEGDVLKWKNSREPYGQILRFDPEHRFHTGSSVPAYEIKLSENGETVWVNRRVVHQRMEKISWKP